MVMKNDLQQNHNVQYSQNSLPKLGACQPAADGALQQQYRTVPPLFLGPLMGPLFPRCLRLDEETVLVRFGTPKHDCCCCCCCCSCYAKFPFHRTLRPEKKGVWRERRKKG